MEAMVKVEIREASVEDLPVILALHAQLGVDDGRVLNQDDAERIFSRMRAYPDYRVYIALAGETVIGTFALLIMDNLAHLGAPSGVVEDVVVDGNWRGQGVGHQMMQFAMELGRARGCYKLTLSSNAGREEAHRFYESLGFRRHGFSFVVETS